MTRSTRGQPGGDGIAGESAREGGDDSGFARLLLEWFDHHGRHDLPWQKERSPYRVWVSEIMLQQTRVETVIPYFNRFMERFPTLATLAAAPVDEVLHDWSGLGYYARARNLHRAAGIAVDRFGGELPTRREELETLPGIGRSTAAAILAQAHGQHEAILDGNCKRVLARYGLIRGWPGNPAVQKRLWVLAESLLPQDRLADYTQALMDLGATLCTRSRPRCGNCPVGESCGARKSDLIAALPEPRPARTLPERTRWAAVVRCDQGLWLQRRPPNGIWGGLYSLPEESDLEGLISAVQARFPHALPSSRDVETLRHAFSHFRLRLQLVSFDIDVEATVNGTPIMDGEDTIWYNPRQLERIGLPAPIAGFLNDFWSEQDG